LLEPRSLVRDDGFDGLDVEPLLELPLREPRLSDDDAFLPALPELPDEPCDPL
jgi:hypothetical protein